MIARLIISLTLLVPRVGYGQETQCPEQIYTDPLDQPDFDCPGPGEEPLVPELQMQDSLSIYKGDVAPWTGVLMDKNRVFLLGLRIKALRRIRWQELLGCQEILNSEIQYVLDSKNADLDLVKSQRDEYKKQAKEMQEEVEKAYKWHRSPALWFAVGFVVAGAGAAVIVVGIRD